MGGIVMTQEDKALLLKDLCARLPYGVKMIDTEPYSAEHNPILTLSYISEDNGIGCRAGKGFMATSLGSIKPYLFPLSSMTEEQKMFLKQQNWCIAISTSGTVETTIEGIDWLNKNHFDFRNLIDKNLAIDCTNLNIY